MDLSIVRRTGSGREYSQETLCSFMGARSVRPRCSAEVEEGRCHLTYDVPVTSGTLFRSITCFD